MNSNTPLQIKETLYEDTGKIGSVSNFTGTSINSNISFIKRNLRCI
jgi:hypothetical protein